MSTLNVLYVEDDPDDVALLCETLTADDFDDYSIVHSADFADALERVRTEKFSTVLLDLNLPNGKGLANIQALKNIDPDLPVVVITGLDCKEKAQRALQRGAQDFIVKGKVTGHSIRQILELSVLRQKNKKQLIRKATHDSLTGLPNRALFEETARAMMRRAARWKKREAVMFLDLNKFKDINDNHGHEVGNIVLKQVATRLKKTLRNSDFVARYGGDEFVIYLDSDRKAPITHQLCQFIADKIIRTVGKPLQVKDLTLEIGLSIGVAIFPDAGETLDVLINNADEAMYRAKNHPEKQYWVVGDTPPPDVLDLDDILGLNKAANSNVMEVRTILIIDDTPEDRMIYRNFLENDDGNYEILEAESVREGQKILENCAPDCIILDNFMPGMHGLDFLQKRFQYNRKIDTAIVMATSADDRASAVKSLKIGADDFLVKSELNQRSLVHAINNAIDKHSLNKKIKAYQDELERSNQELSEFAQTVAHDLKAPMRKIITFCNLLEQQGEELINEEAKHYIKRMGVSSTRMQALIDNLLTYAQIMRSSEKREHMSVNTLLDEVLVDLDVWLSERDAHVEKSDLPDLPVYPTRIRQLFLNIITNGVKYRREDATPVVKITHTIKDDMCLISMEDNGMGMSGKDLSRIFAPFNRLHAADDIEGTGLGLSICKKIAEKHDGAIEVRSEQGKGSIFIITLPIKHNEDWEDKAS